MLSPLFITPANGLNFVQSPLLAFAKPIAVYVDDVIYNIGLTPGNLKAGFDINTGTLTFQNNFNGFNVVGLLIKQP